MKFIKKSVSSDAGAIQIRNYKQKDIEYIINRHRELYEVDFGFFLKLADYVERYVKEFDKFS